METKDQMLVSSRNKLHSSVPSSYVQPPECRPGNLIVASGKAIPVVDLGGHDRADIVKRILKASEEYGFFQVINHGVSKELMDDTLNILKEFHAMPGKEKVSECSKDPSGNCKLYTSSENYNKDAVQYWKDTLKHPCPPSGEYMQYWPQKPTKYREVVGKYTRELRKLGLKILELLFEGLGLNPGYYCGGDLSENPVLLAHHYPPCPEPSLTLGLAKHRDPTVITILLQDEQVHGLQVLKDGQWIGVEPIPHAFVVNIGLLLQIITNERLIGAEHRVVTNSTTSRTTVSYFIYPSNETIIEPAKVLMNGSTPIYRSMSFGEFQRNFFDKGPKIEEELQKP